MTYKIIVGLLIASLPQFTQTQMYWDHRDGMFFTHPRPEEMNNVEYDMLARQFVGHMIELMKKHKCSPEYALKMAKVCMECRFNVYVSPTSTQFMKDIALITDPKQIEEMMPASSWF
jgi:hypothetical protein